jgi:hypothetical protein
VDECAQSGHVMHEGTPTSTARGAVTRLCRTTTTPTTSTTGIGTQPTTGTGTTTDHAAEPRRPPGVSGPAARGSARHVFVC